MITSELQKKHFAVLKMKYQVPLYEDTTTHRFLYLILRKAYLRMPVTNLELQWLAENRFFKAVEIISFQNYQAAEQKRLDDEFLQLRTKYHIPKELEIQASSSIYSILWKLDTGHILTDGELERLNHQGLSDSVAIAQDSLLFSKLKIAYNATQHISQIPEEPLYSILKKLDQKNALLDCEVEWLVESNFSATLEIHSQHVNERKSELEFSSLKASYQVDSHPDTSISSPLYLILKKLRANKELKHSECAWLKQQELESLIAIDRENTDRTVFADLKQQYDAVHYPISDPTDHLFDILKKFLASEAKVFELSKEAKVLIGQADLKVSHDDIQWLLDKELPQTAERAKRIHFKALKSKYQILDDIAFDPFYEIMSKLERQERLDPKQIIQLIEEGQLSHHGKIAIAHYRLEALFYEQEYQRTKNLWNLASASSNWRKAKEPRKALEATKKIDLNTVKELKLKSALLVTRGAAFRDIDQLDNAEDCAIQAIECQPNNHQPFTLMGAICYDRGKYIDGDDWFEKAVKLGANSPDKELKRIIETTKNKEKRREAAAHLFKKDSKRFQWAKQYLSQKEKQN